MTRKRMIVVDDFEHRIMVEALADRRNDYITEKKPTEDVSNLILKVIDAPAKRRKILDREER